MRKVAIALVVLVIGAGAWADQITIRNIPYANVRVIDAGNGKITYELRGRNYDKPLSDVNYIHVASQPGLTKAESLLKAGKADAALAAYDAIKTDAGQDWLPRLVCYRRLRAADAARKTDRAVADWLAIVKECSGSSAAAAMVPKGLGKKKSPGNAKAIALLEQRMQAKNTPAVTGAVKELLLSLYELEGLADKAAKLDGGTGGASAAPGPARPVAPTDVTVSAGSLSGQLGDAANQIKAGRYAQAADAIQARIRRYGDRELPTALLLRGKALLLLYEKGAKKDRATLLAAGLCFMRVAACISPGEPEVPEATFLAGRVCVHLGNTVAATNAYRLILQRHPGTPWAEQARKALAGGN